MGGQTPTQPDPVRRRIPNVPCAIATARPTLRVRPATGRTTTVVLVLHGGRSHSDQPTTPGQLAYRRMVPIATAIHRWCRDDGGAVWLMRNRVRGWNEPQQDAVLDARWALDEIERRHPESDVVLVGHSMGGRAALRVADRPNVWAVCALAPWLEPNEPIAQLAGRSVLIAHGTRDRWTDPAASAAYVARARRAGIEMAWSEIQGAGHFMLRKRAAWQALIRAFVT